MSELTARHHELFDAAFDDQVKRTWEELPSPDESELGVLKILMWGVIRRIGLYPTWIRVDPDYSGCVVYGNDVFIGCANDGGHKVSVLCRSNKALNGSFSGALTLKGRLITYIKNTRSEGDQPFSPSVWAASPETVAKDTAEFAALSDEEKAVATKALTGFAKMSAAFDHGA